VNQEETSNKASEFADEKLTGETRVSENEAHLQYVLSAFPGIILAGGLYPLCLGVLALMWQAVWDGRFDLSDTLGFLGIFAMLGGMFGVIISAVTGLISIGLMWAMNRSLGYPLDGGSAAISAGSLAGYLPTAWVFFTPMFGKDFQESATIGFMGPILAMLLGAIGASWTAKRYTRPKFHAAVIRKKYRLSISHMMIATTWIAVVFALANFFGGTWFAIASAAWFGLQAIMLNLILMIGKFLRVKQHPGQKTLHETGSPKRE